METIINCPLCAKAQFNLFITCEDFTVSRETFTIVKCKNCNFVFTNPRPDQSIIGKYYQSADYISHSSSNEGVINKLYLFARKYTLKKKGAFISRLAGPDKNRLIDIGCGTGDFLGEMKRRGYGVAGFEPDKQARARAIHKHGIKVYDLGELFTGSIDEVSFVTMWHVMEHVPNVHDYLLQIHNLLTPNGKLIMAVPNYESKDAIIYREKWAAYDVPRHLNHFTIETMTQYLNKNGFKLTAVEPMHLDAFYIAMLSEKYRGSSPIVGMVKGAINGLYCLLLSLYNKRKSSSLMYVAEKV